jgi:AAA domain
MTRTESFKSQPDHPTSLAEPLEPFAINHNDDEMQNSELERWRQFIYPWPELAALDTTIISPMLWDGLLPKDDIALFAALKGRGKTTLLIQLSIAIVRGKDSFLGRKLDAPNRRVLYVKLEGSGKTRLARLMNRYGEANPGLVFVAASRLSIEEVVKAIETKQAETPFDMVIIDCLGNIFTGDQNSNSDAQKFWRFFDALATQTLLLFVHHFGKGAANNNPHDKYIQGATAFVQRPRTVLILSEEAGSTDRYLHVPYEDDMSDEFKEDALVLRFDKETKLYTSDGKTTKTVESINAQHAASGGRKKEKELKLRQLLIMGKVYKRHEIADLVGMDSNNGTLGKALPAALKAGWLLSKKRGEYELAPP